VYSLTIWNCFVTILITFQSLYYSMGLCSRSLE
jgi:hypothetical protein